MGKSGPYATFHLIFLGLGWPWVGKFDDFIIIFICFPTQHNLVCRKHPTVEEPYNGWLKSPTMVEEPYNGWRGLQWSKNPTMVEGPYKGWLKIPTMVGWRALQWLVEGPYKGWSKSHTMVGWMALQWLKSPTYNGWLEIPTMVGWRTLQLGRNIWDQRRDPLMMVTMMMSSHY